MGFSLSSFQRGETHAATVPGSLALEHLPYRHMGVAAELCLYRTATPHTPSAAAARAVNLLERPTIPAPRADGTAHALPPDLMRRKYQ
jgi:hypothetical protein